MKKASKENNYHYNPYLQKFASQNRKNMTKGEACLWKYVLKNRNVLGYQFRRQRPVLNYIADFMCMELLLIIEVDGFTHYLGDPEDDKKRDAELQKIGFTILRFSDWAVLHRISEVHIEIENWIKENAIAPPTPRNRKRQNKVSE